MYGHLQPKARPSMKVIKGDVRQVVKSCLQQQQFLHRDWVAMNLRSCLFCMQSVAKASPGSSISTFETTCSGRSSSDTISMP